MIDRNRLTGALTSAHRDVPVAGPSAAVAAIFRPRSETITSPADVELLFIERATKESDPWSGQMALPGGRTEPSDADAAATAERETLEEIGVDLGPVPTIGRLSPVQGGPRTGRALTVTAHAYWWEGDRPVTSPNYEVAAVVWAGLDTLLDPGRGIEYRYPRYPDQIYPGILLEDDHRVVWGLTLRFLMDLFERLDEPFLSMPLHSPLS